MLYNVRVRQGENMKKGQITLMISMVSMVFMTIYGCGGGSDSSNSNVGGDGGDGSTAAVTETQSQQIAAALAETTTKIFIGGGMFGYNAAAPLNSKSLPAMTPPVKAASITVNATDYCISTPLVNVSSLTPLGSATMNGSDLGSDGRGTCSVKAYGNDGDATFLLTDLMYNEFSGGSAMDDVTLDGEMQLSTSLTQSVGNVQVTGTMKADGLLVGFLEDGSTRVCEASPLEIQQNSNYQISGNSVSYTTQLSGCMKICDSAFDVSGTDSGSFTFPN